MRYVYLVLAVLFPNLTYGAPIVPANTYPSTPVAVLEFEPGPGVVSDTTRVLSARMRENLLRNPAYKLIDKGNMDTVLTEQKLALKFCIDNAKCLVNVGKQLAVRELIIGKLTRHEDDEFVLVVEHTDVETAQVLHSATRNCKCALDKLLESVDLIAKEFFPQRIPPNKTLLIVRTVPAGAEIRIDGKFVGYSDFVVDDLVPGPKKVELRSEGYRAAVQTIDLRGGEAAELRLKLELDSGAILVISKPEEAVALVDGMPMQLQDGLGKVALPKGEHVVRVTHPDFVDFEQRVLVAWGKLTTVRAELEPRPGTVRLTSNPAGATIFVDGQQFPGDGTPDKVTLSPGVYNMRLEKQDFEAAERLVTVEANRTQKLDFVLTREPSQLKRALKIGGWILASTGAGAAAFGFVSGTQARRKYDEPGHTQAEYDAALANVHRGNQIIGAGAAAAGLGISSVLISLTLD